MSAVPLLLPPTPGDSLASMKRLGVEAAATCDLRCQSQQGQDASAGVHNYVVEEGHAEQDAARLSWRRKIPWSCGLYDETRFFDCQEQSSVLVSAKKMEDGETDGILS
ncbi:hypothetical protein MTO96_031001 [Rhipicephalus appendiculatus]